MKEFDSLWAQECINDVFDTGCEDDKLALIQLGTENVQVEIKTSGGTTERTNISNIIMQRSTSGGLLCTTSIDKLPQLSYRSKALLYRYKKVDTSSHLKSLLEPAVPPIRLFIMINMMPLRICVVKGNYYIALLRNEPRNNFLMSGP